MARTDDEPSDRERPASPGSFEVLWTPAPEGVPPARAPQSPAPPGSRGGSRAGWLAVGLAGVACAIAVAAYLRSRDDTPSAPAPPEPPAARAAADGEALREVSSTLERSRAELADAERARRELELRVAEQEELRLAAERTARDEAEALRAELDATRAKSAALEEAARAAAERVSELERQVVELTARASDSARAASAFDAALALVGEARLPEAREALAGLAAIGLGGTPLLSAILDGQEEAARFEAGLSAGKVSPIALVALRAAATRLEAARTAFSVERLAWLAEQGGAEERLKRVDELLAPLRERLARGPAALEALDGEEWKQLSAAFKPADSAAVLAHSERFGCGHALELAPRVASELPSALLRYRSLDVAALREVTGLSGWMKLVRSGTLVLPERSRADLELLEFAQRWYDEDPGNDAPADWTALALPGPADERLDWRKQLELVSRLSRADSGWPIRENGLRILCCVKADGTVEWLRELALNVREGVWRIQRDRLSGDGRKLLDSSALRVERRGHEYVIAGADELLLDLHARGTAVTVAPYPPHVEVVVPLALGLSPDELAAFRAQSGPCLVQQQGGARRWFEPGHGLVREELRTPSGSEVRDLVFAR